MEIEEIIQNYPTAYKALTKCMFPKIYESKDHVRWIKSAINDSPRNCIDTFDGLNITLSIYEQVGLDGFYWHIKFGPNKSLLKQGMNPCSSRNEAELITFPILFEILEEQLLKK